jgi:hypothetical protein
VTTGTAHGLTTGDTASIDGVADYTFCGVYTVTVTNANVFTYSQTAGGASSSGGFSTKLTGTWGLYAGGTGPSLHNGPVIVSASSQMPALRVTQGGSGYALIVEDAANPDTSAFIISNAGDLTINTNKFTVAAASGNTVIAGTTSLNGNVTFATDATYDIGASGATRPRDLFLSRNLVVGGTLTLAGGVNLNGNVTIGDASTDTLTINSTITSNLIFTDNTYDIGASGATRPKNLYLAGLLTMGGALTVDSTTDSSSTTTGSIQTDGGLGVAKALFVGTTINAAGAIKSTGANLVNEANAIKISQESASTSTITAYGTNASTRGTLNVALKSSDGTLQSSVATFSSSALTLASNLLFTDNTYDIGANGATRPRNAWFSSVVTAGQAGSLNYQIAAVDYATGTGGGYADGIYTSSIKAGGYQAFGFDSQYQNAGSWVSSKTVASIIDGYNGSLRFFSNSGLTAGTPYTPQLKFTVDPNGLAAIYATVTTDPAIYRNLTIGRGSLDATYGGYLGLRAISGDERQGLFVHGTGALTLVSQYDMDFITGQTAVPLAANTGLAMRVNRNATVTIGGGTANTFPLEVYKAGSSSTNAVLLNLFYSAAGSAQPWIKFATSNGDIGQLGFQTAGASSGQFNVYTGDGSSLVTRYNINQTGVHNWNNVGSSSGGTAMTLDGAGLGIGAATTGKFLAYQAGAIQNYQGAYGSSGTFQTGTGSVTLGGGANPRGIGVLINANRAISTTLTYGNNYETFGLIAVANVGTGGGYGTTGIAGYAESDGGVYGLRADAKTTATGGTSIAVGLYVGSVTGSSTNYGVYVNDSAAVNYFAGSVGIGMGPSSRLHLYQASADVVQNIQSDNGYNTYINYRGFSGGISFGRDGGTGYFRWNTAVGLGGTQVMTLATDNMQLRVGTTSAVTDAFAGTAYPAIVSSSSVAYRPIDGNGAASLVSKAFATSPGNTYTVRVYPSDTVYDVLDIRVGGYSSSGSGSANAYFAYGGHVGAYQLNTVFNTATGNVVISAPSIGASFIQFTITITGGAGGVYVVKVSDAGNTSNKTAWITVT